PMTVGRCLLRPSTVHQEFRVLRRVAESGRSKETLAGQSVFGGGVSCGSEAPVPAALCLLVGAGKDRVEGSGVPAQCDPHHDGNGSLDLQRAHPDEKGPVDLTNGVVWI